MEALKERQRSELRQETYDKKLRALAVLMASASLFDFRELDAEDAVVRARCARLQSLIFQVLMDEPLMKTTVSSNGRVVLPAELREYDGIEPGDEFTVERLDRGEYL